MKNKFVNTSNVSAFYKALTHMENRGAEECTFVVVDGEPGLGKTTMLQHWVAQTGSIYLRAKTEWSPNWMLSEILTSMGRETPYGYQKRFEAVVQELSQRQYQQFNGTGVFGIVIDEADHISRNYKLMETLRDLSDLLQLPIVLVGMGKIRNNLTRFKQISSRVSKYVAFNPATEKDVRALFDGLCEVEVDDNIIQFVTRISKVYTREIKEAIAHVELFGKRNEGDIVRLKDMAGEVILNDRKTSNEIIVPEGVA